MKTSKKVIIAVIAVVLAAAIALGVAFAILPRSGIQEFGAYPEPFTYLTAKTPYVVGKAPYAPDCVFETQLGMDRYWHAYHSYGNALDVVLQCTKDNEPVVLSGDLDEISNAHILFGEDASVRTLTLEELKTVNLVYNFKAEDGTMPYKVYSTEEMLNQVNVLSLRDFADYYMSPQRSGFILFFRFKDESEIADYKTVLDQLQALAEEHYVNETVIFRTENTEIAKYIDEACPLLRRTATKGEAGKLYQNSLFGKAQSELPYKVIFADADSRFAQEKFIHYAHNLGLAIVLNDPDTADITRLFKYGVNGFATSNIEESCQILKDAVKARREAARSEAAAAK